MLRKICKMLLSTIYPNRCPYCQEIILHNKTCCDSCNRTLERHLERINVFNDIEKNLKSYCFTPLKYSGVVKQAIWRYKFRGCKVYSEHFADEIIKGLNDIYSNFNFDIITFVPMFKTRKLERGYNQSEILAKEISQRLNIECKSTLVKVRDNEPQHNLTSFERINNVKDIYQVKSKGVVEGKRILLCDDVFTTGNTLKECCKELYRSGAECVECVAIAHTILN